MNAKATDIEDIIHMVCPTCEFEWHKAGLSECPKCGLQREAKVK
jgi:ssDNA-binding Zn-finger/Zn-ribbon topoisomerase 1